MAILKRAQAGRGEGLDAVKGSKVEVAHLLEGALVMKLRGRGGEVVLDAPGRAEIRQARGSSTKGEAGFQEALKGLLGARVRGATVDHGLAVKLDLGGAGTLVISLIEGEYPGNSALDVKGPGRCYQSYHCDGVSTLSL